MTTRFVDRRPGQATLWVVAFLLTVVTAGFQRRTGPTWPVAVESAVGGAPVSATLLRSHGGEGGALVSLLAPDPGVRGDLVWRRFPTDDPWTRAPLVRLQDRLVGELPHQPPAGKVEYFLELSRGAAVARAPADHPVVLRFKGAVPGSVLLPHIMCMFLGMVIGARALLGGIVDEQKPQRHIPWLLLFMVPGGLVLGPVIQKYAFGAYWTGWPVGEDLTDTKTFVSVAAWVVAWIVARRFGERRPQVRRAAILAAAVIMLAVYFIPHSVRGSQIDWSRTSGSTTAAPSTGG